MKIGMKIENEFQRVVGLGFKPTGIVLGFGEWNELRAGGSVSWGAGPSDLVGVPFFCGLPIVVVPAGSPRIEMAMDPHDVTALSCMAMRNERVLVRGTALRLLPEEETRDFAYPKLPGLP